MTFTITTSSKVLKSNATENLEVLTDTSDTGSRETSIAIDYTLYYSRIATALETIATNSTSIKNSIAAIEIDIDNISTRATTIADKQTSINDNIAMIRYVLDNSAPQLIAFEGKIQSGEINPSTGQPKDEPGTTLTISTVYQGTVSVGMKIIGDGILPNTFVISGTGSTWVVSQSQKISNKKLFGVGITGYLSDAVFNISEKHTLIESYQKKIKELGEGVGYRIKSPYDIFSMVTVWKLLIEEGKILELDGDGSKVQESLAKVVEYMQKINQNIPKD